MKKKENSKNPSLIEIDKVSLDSLLKKALNTSLPEAKRRSYKKKPKKF